MALSLRCATSTCCVVSKTFCCRAYGFAQHYHYASLPLSWGVGMFVFTGDDGCGWAKAGDLALQAIEMPLATDGGVLPMPYHHVVEEPDVEEA